MIRKPAAAPSVERVIVVDPSVSFGRVKGTAFEKGSIDALRAGRRSAPALIVRTSRDANILGLMAWPANVGGPGAKAAAVPSRSTSAPGVMLLDILGSAVTLVRSKWNKVGEDGDEGFVAGINLVFARILPTFLQQGRSGTSKGVTGRLPKVLFGCF
jgi:hypothetical protein